MLRILSALLAGLLLCAQTPMLPGFPPGTFQNRAALDAASAPAYTGPGDIVTFNEWGSCTFAYSAALATTTTSLCDLVASTGGAAVCTLRASSSGQVDQTAYCPGSLTPSAACAAASGGSCRVAKVYAQIGAGGGWTQATLSKMPDFVFNAVGSIPSLSCVGARITSMLSGAVASQSAPYTMLAVASRTADFTNQLNALATSVDNELGFAGTVDTAYVYAGSGPLNKAATDSTPHVLQATVNGASGTLNVDATTQATGNAGNDPITAAVTSICSYVNGFSFVLTGVDGEFGWYAGTYNSTVQSNAKSRWGL